MSFYKKPQAKKLKRAEKDKKRASKEPKIQKR